MDFEITSSFQTAIIEAINEFFGAILLGHFIKNELGSDESRVFIFKQSNLRLSLRVDLVTPNFFVQRKCQLSWTNIVFDSHTNIIESFRWKCVQGPNFFFKCIYQEKLAKLGVWSKILLLILKKTRKLTKSIWRPEKARNRRKKKPKVLKKNFLVQKKFPWESKKTLFSLDFLRKQIPNNEKVF